jgi:acyl carrier protein
MRTPEAISAWLVEYLAKLLAMSPSEIDTTTSFGEYGIDSAGAAGLSGDLSDWLGVTLKDSIAFEYPTIEQLSAHLSTQMGR